MKKIASLLLVLAMLLTAVCLAENTTVSVDTATAREGLT